MAFPSVSLPEHTYQSFDLMTGSSSRDELTDEGDECGNHSAYSMAKKIYPAKDVCSLAGN